AGDLHAPGLVHLVAGDDADLGPPRPALRVRRSLSHGALLPLSFGLLRGGDLPLALERLDAGHLLPRLFQLAGRLQPLGRRLKAQVKEVLDRLLQLLRELLVRQRPHFFGFHGPILRGSWIGDRGSEYRAVRLPRRSTIYYPRS